MMYGYDKMSMDLLQHELVPKHEILSDEEKNELFTKLHITKNDLPKILDSDSVVKKIGAKKDDVLRITRTSSTAGTAIYFRLVIPE